MYDLILKQHTSKEVAERKWAIRSAEIDLGRSRDLVSVMKRDLDHCGHWGGWSDVPWRQMSEKELSLENLNRQAWGGLSSESGSLSLLMENLEKMTTEELVEFVKAKGLCFDEMTKGLKGKRNSDISKIHLEISQFVVSIYERTVLLDHRSWDENGSSGLIAFTDNIRYKASQWDDRAEILDNKDEQILILAKCKKLLKKYQGALNKMDQDAETLKQLESQLSSPQTYVKIHEIPHVVTVTWPQN